MRALSIARLDLERVRARTLIVVFGLFAIVGGGRAYFVAGSARPGLAETLPSATLSLFVFLVPPIALWISYESIVAPRTDGQLQFLLSLPYSRGDVFAGTYLGRVAILSAGVLAGYLALALVALVRGLVVAPVQVVLAALFAVALGVVFVGVGVAISALAGSTRTAGALAFGIFLLLFFVWSSVPGLLAYALAGFSNPGALPGWAPLVRTLNPLASLALLVERALAGPGIAARPLFGATVDSARVAALVLAGWLVGAPLAGYLSVRRGDL